MTDNLFSRVKLNERDRGFSSATIVPLGTKALVFVSGDVGRDASGKIVPGGFEAEVRQLFANLQRVLTEAGGGMQDVVRMTAYVKNLEDYPIYAKVRLEVFGSEHWPASATVGVSDLLLDAKIEIDAIAVVATAAAPQ